MEIFSRLNNIDKKSISSEELKTLKPDGESRLSKAKATCMEIIDSLHIKHLISHIPSKSIFASSGKIVQPIKKGVAAAQGEKNLTEQEKISKAIKRIRKLIPVSTKNIIYDPVQARHEDARFDEKTGIIYIGKNPFEKESNLIETIAHELYHRLSWVNGTLFEQTRAELEVEACENVLKIKNELGLDAESIRDVEEYKSKMQEQIRPGSAFDYHIEKPSDWEKVRKKYIY